MKRTNRAGANTHIVRNRSARRIVGTVSLLSMGWAMPALAQDDSAAAAARPPAQGAYVDNGDIIVTARKRQESILKVPVVLTAISQQKLENVQVTQVTDLPRLVPGLIIGGSLLSIGPQVTIRGVGTSSLDPGVDQSVSLNIDGLSLGQGLAFGSAMFDVGQVEVLKGPQALFYGKSSPGGVISLRTADPGEDFEVIARAGYEFEAREKRGELVVSGPLSDTLGARVATLYSKADGYFKNNGVATPGTGALSPRGREPRPENFVIRGTLLWKPVDGFSARLKVNHAYDHQIDADLKQLDNCPGGPGKSFSPFGIFPAVHFLGANEDCKYNRTTQMVYLDPSAFPNVANGGVPYLQDKQDFGTLELNYDLTPHLTLTSTTAYYKLKSSSLVNPTYTSGAGPTFAVTNQFGRKEFTQELRVNSDFSGPFNFTAGGFYEDGKLTDHVRFIRNTSFAWLSPAVLGVDILNDNRTSTVDIKTYSLFGQARYKLSQQLELAAGVRWSDEKRNLGVYDFQNNLDLTPLLPTPEVGSKTWSPEFTVTYTPSDDLTVFGSYKQGYKSGSFSVAVPAALKFGPTGNIIGTTDKSFGDEKVRGYEIGVKARLLDRSLLANIAFYDYRYQGLQVGANEPAPGGVPEIRTVNAGKARTYGVDFDASYRPRSIEGLSLNASINWNHGTYSNFNTIPCYVNQTISQGCTLNPDPFQLDPATGKPRFSAQDLSGSRMVRSPKWAINFGFDYEVPVGSNLKLGFTNNNQYTTDYVQFPATGGAKGFNLQPDYFKVDAGISLKGPSDRWEVAVIGKNLTDKIITSNCSLSNAAGSIILPFGGDNYGGVSPGAAGSPETICFPDGGGRSIWLRLTLRPFARD